MFSRHTRNQTLEAAANNLYDLVVIGGGITGAGILLDARKRGLKVLLVEMQDFSEGTSSRSTKLIHGGIRYLKQGDFSLVKEVGRERSIVRKNARHLVHPVPVLVPIYKGGSMKLWQLKIGMFIFEFLVHIKEQFLSKSYSKSEALKREPTLNPEGLLGAVKYFENRTDDGRLTIEVIKTAVRKGANAVNYVKAEEFLFGKEGQINGVKVKDRLQDRTINISAKAVVNATGPWVDDIRERDDLMSKNKLLLTKGVHLVFKKDKFPINHAVYFDAPGKRMVFAVPSGDITYLGTTDTIYKGNIQNPDVSEDDIEYLISAISKKFPSLSVTKKDIISSWSGLRPLIREEGKSPSEVSRKDELFVSSSGLVSIAGGKLTGYRLMARKAVDVIMKRLTGATGKCITEDQLLVGGEFDSDEAVAKKRSECRELANKIGVSTEESDWLFSKFGSETALLLKNNDVFKSKELPLYLRLALEYCCNYEMNITKEDFLMRRTGLRLFKPDEAKRLESFFDLEFTID